MYAVGKNYGDDIKATYDRVYNDTINVDPTSTGYGKNVRSDYKAAADEAYKKTLASGIEDANGNADSYAAANANRQKAAMVSGAHSDILNYYNAISGRASDWAQNRSSALSQNLSQLQGNVDNDRTSRQIDAQNDTERYLQELQYKSENDDRSYDRENTLRDYLTTMINAYGVGVLDYIDDNGNFDRAKLADARTVSQTDYTASPTVSTDRAQSLLRPAEGDTPPFARSRGELALKLDVLSGQKVTVGNREFTVKGASKSNVHLMDENGQTRTVSLVGKELTYGENGFIVRDKGGLTRVFVFSDELVDAVADPVVTSQNDATQVNNESAYEEGSAEKAEQTLEETSSIQPEKAVDDYPYDQKKALVDYAQYRNATIRDYVTGILDGTDKSTKRLYLNRVSDKAAERIKSITGIDPHGFKTALDSHIVQHIENRHGKNGQQDHSMSEIADWERIQYVLDNYDSIDPAGNSSAYTTIKKRPLAELIG